MGGEEAATAAGAFLLHEPGQCIDHGLLRLPGAAEKRDAMLVGCVFFLAAVAPGDESAGYRRQLAAAGDRENLAVPVNDFAAADRESQPMTSQPEKIAMRA